MEPYVGIVSIHYPSILYRENKKIFKLINRGFTHHAHGSIMVEFKYEVVERIAVLSESSKGWTKELNLISWNDREPKYDIREWSPDGSKMGKGITLSDEEVAVLKKALDTRDL